EEVSHLPIAQDMGYVIIGQKIDAHDWKQVDNRQITADQIVANVFRELDNGNIILFHDGGGDRAQTLIALPQVIDRLRAEGYDLVLVSDLLNRTRAQVLLPLSEEERWGARADGFIFGIYHWSRVFIATIFIVGIVLVSSRALIIGLLAV